MSQTISWRFAGSNELRDLRSLITIYLSGRCNGNQPPDWNGDQPVSTDWLQISR
jgi:hypothetical protein